MFATILFVVFCLYVAFGIWLDFYDNRPDDFEEIFKKHYPELAELCRQAEEREAKELEEIENFLNEE